MNNELKTVLIPAESYNGRETVYLTGLIYSPHREASRKFIEEHEVKALDKLRTGA